MYPVQFFDTSFVEAFTIVLALLYSKSTGSHVGQFGEVFKGVLRQGSESTPVAVKMTKRTISEYLQQSFLKEMRIMSEMVHPNIVRLYGLVTEGECVCVCVCVSE